MKLSRYAPLEHPLAHQFQRAIESLTAALAPDSARQYRGTSRYFLIYLGDRSSCRLFVKSVAPRSPHPRLVCPSALTHRPWRRPSTSVAYCFCAAFWRSLPGPHSFPIWLI